MRLQWLIQTVKNSERKGRYQYMITDSGERVCTRAFLKLYNINKNLLVKCNMLAKRNAVAASPSVKFKGLSSDSLKCMSWFEEFVSACGDRMPDKGVILLPYKTTKTNETAVPVSRMTFENIWRHHFPHVKVKQANSFSMCNICAGLGMRLESEDGPLKRAEAMQERKLHNIRQMMERKYYYKKREESRKNPSSYLSLIIDGMDQSKSSLPHIVGRRAKVVNPSDLLKTHITGVISHGHNEFSTYLDFGQYPHDPNLTMNILLKILYRIASRNNNKLPPVLYLQADNCFRENKNKFVLGFCELLVRERIFSEIQLSFLIVGHTHEDVDAGFSRIARKLRTNDAETIPELRNILPNNEEVNEMLDIKSWMLPELSEPKHHTCQHHFKFTRVDGKPAVFYKNLQNHPWIEMTPLFDRIPRGKPKLLKPDYSKICVERIEKQIKSMSYLLKGDKTLSWWKTFIESLRKDNKRQKVPKFIDSLPRQPLEDQNTEEYVESAIPVEIRRLLAKETDTVQVEVRKVKRRKVSNGTSSGKKRKGLAGRRRKQLVVTSVKTYIFYIPEEKKHLWFIILCSILLLEAAFDICLIIFLFYFFIILVQRQYGLYIFLKMMHVFWLQVLALHVAAVAAQVNYYSVPSLMIC